MINSVKADFLSGADPFARGQLTRNIVAVITVIDNGALVLAVGNYAIYLVAATVLFILFLELFQFLILFVILSSQEYQFALHCPICLFIKFDPQIFLYLPPEVFFTLSLIFSALFLLIVTSLLLFLLSYSIGSLTSSFLFVTGIKILFQLIELSGFIIFQFF